MFSRRALVIRIGALGDVLLTRRLSYSLSLAGFRTTLFAPRRHASLLEADPWIESVLDSESPAFAGAFEGSAHDGMGRFDLAVVLSRSGGLIRFAGSVSDRLLEVSPEPDSRGLPIAEQWARAIEPEKNAFTGDLPDLPTDAARVFQRGATLLHPGSGSPRKNWPLEKFVELSRALREKGHAVRWLLGPAEAGVDLPPGETALSNFELPDLAATLHAARVFIGNDSGVSHLSAAVGTSTTVLFGPTSADAWRPDGPRVRAIDAPDGDLTTLSVGSVLDGIEN